METEVFTDLNANGYLTDTLWNQDGSIYICINGKQTMIGGTYNQYCPYINGESSEGRSVTGCTNTADSQVIYYWLEQGYTFDFEVKSSDYISIQNVAGNIYASESPEYGISSISAINNILSTNDITSGDFIAALNVYCGWKNNSIYGTSTASTFWGIDDYEGIYNLKTYAALGFDSHYSIYQDNRDFFTTSGNDPVLTDLGYSIVRENIDYGEVVRVDIPGHSIYLDGYRYNEERGEYEYHLNYGWGTKASATKWYKISELVGDSAICNIGIDITPHVTVVIKSDASGYAAGSMVRGLERINHVQNDTATTVTFDDVMSGKTIAYGDSIWKVTSTVDVSFTNFTANMDSSARNLFVSTNELEFCGISSSIVQINSSAKTFTVTGSEDLVVNFAGGSLYAGSSALTADDIRTSLQNFSVSGFSAVEAIAAGAAYAVVGDAGNDKVVLTDKSVVLGSLDLGSGTNSISIDGGSVWYGNLESKANVTLTVTAGTYDAMIVLKSDASAFASNASITVDCTKLTSDQEIELVDASGTTGSDVLGDMVIHVICDGESADLSVNGTASCDFAGLRLDGGVLIVEQDPIQEDAVKVYSNGQEVKKAATMNGETLASGGNDTMTVDNRGKVRNTTINAGASVSVTTKGKATDTTINADGTMTVSNEGIAKSTTVNAGGVMTVSVNGKASATTVAGTMNVSGTAEETTVNANGTVIISDGGSAVGLIVNQSGTVNVNNGSTVKDTTVHAGGNLTAGAGSILTGTLEIEQNATVTVTQGATVDFAVAGHADPTVAFINDLSLVSGRENANYTITIDADQAMGDYVLAEGAADFNKTITVKNSAGTELGSLSVGGRLIDGEKIYYLNQTEGVLSLSVASSVITITANSASKKYDGTELSDSGYTFTSNILYDGDELIATVEGSITNAGSVANEVVSYKVMRGELDVTNLYTFADSVDGKLTVSKRKVTLTSATDSKDYDGKALVNENVEIGGDGFVDGEGVILNVTGSQTRVGSSDNTFTYAFNRATNADNYDVTVKNGKLTVYPYTPVITVTAESLSKMYDGKELKAENYTWTGSLFDGDTLIVEVDGSITDAGTAESTVSKLKIMRGKLDVTSEYETKKVSGTLNIDKRSITLTSGSAKRSCNGKPLTAETVTVSGDGIASGESFVYTDFASQTDVGACKNTFTVYGGTEQTSLDNYDIQMDYGVLVVTCGSKYVIDDRTKELDVDFDFNQLYIQNGGVLSISGEAVVTVKTLTLKNGAVQGTDAEFSANKVNVSGSGNLIDRELITTSLTVSAGKDNSFNELTVSGDLFVTGKSGKISLGNYSDTTLKNAVMTTGNDTLSIGKYCDFAADSIDFDLGNNTLKVGACSIVNVKDGIKGVSTLTLTAGKYEKKYGVVDPTEFYTGSIEMAGKSSKITVGNYSIFRTSALVGTDGNDTVRFGNNVTASVLKVDLGDGKDTLTIGNDCDITFAAANSDADLSSLTIGKNSDVWLSQSFADCKKTKVGKGSQIIVIEEETKDDLFSTAQIAEEKVDGYLGGSVDAIDFYNVGDWKSVDFSGDANLEVRLWSNETTSVAWESGMDISSYAKFSVGFLEDKSVMSDTHRYSLQMLA